MRPACTGEQCVATSWQFLMNLTTSEDVLARPPGGSDWRQGLAPGARRSVRRWVWSLAGLTFLILVIGGITRLTQSGLSMVNWEPIMGVVPPLTEAQWQETFELYRQYPEYQQLRRGMTLSEFKFIFFWEYLHRLVARTLGVVFLIPFVYFWRRGWLSRPLAARALVLFGLGALQGLMGWLMVASGLVERPSVSHFRLAAHLSLAFIIFGYGVWLARDLRIADARPAAAGTRRVPARWLVWIGGLLALQIVWGAFVAGLKAGKFLNTFPLMAGRLVPPGLVRLDPALYNFVQNPVTVQWTHRVLGTVLLLASAALFVAVRRAEPDATSRQHNVALFVLIAGQYLLGVLTLLYAVPVTLGVFHQAVAMVIIGVWVSWLHHVRNAAVPTPSAVTGA
jgi:heme a synthase